MTKKGKITKHKTGDGNLENDAKYGMGPTIITKTEEKEANIDPTFSSIAKQGVTATKGTVRGVHEKKSKIKNDAEYGARDPTH